MDKPQKTIKFWQGPLPGQRNPASKDHLDAIRVMKNSPNNKGPYGQYYTAQNMSPALVKRGNDYQNISLSGTTNDRLLTEKDSHILRSKDDRVMLPSNIYSGGGFTDAKPHSQNLVQRHKFRQTQVVDQSLPQINMSPQKSSPNKWQGAKSSELSKVMENHKKVMRNLDQVWGYPKQGNVSYNYMSEKDKEMTNISSNMNSQKESLRQMPPNIHTGAEHNTEYTDQYVKSNGKKRPDNRSIEMEKGKGYSAAIGYPQQSLHAEIVAAQRANQDHIKHMVRNTIQNNRKKPSFGSIQSPNEPYSGAAGGMGATKDPHKTSIESGLTYSNGQLRNNVYVPGQNGNLTPGNKQSSIFSNSAPRGNSKLKSVSRLDGMAHLTMNDQSMNKINYNRKLVKAKPNQSIPQQTVFYNNRAANTTQFTHDSKNVKTKGEKNKVMKKMLAAQQKNERKLVTKRGLLNKEEAQEYLSMKEYMKPLKPNKMSHSTHKERPGDVLYAAPQKRMMEQYYAMQQNDQNFKKLMESQGLPDSTIENMFKIRRNTTQNTIANMKKAQELRIQNIQIVEQMNLKSTKKNQIPTITQDLEESAEKKRNLNRSSLSNNTKQVSSQKKQILSLQQTLRKSKKVEKPDEKAAATYTESTDRMMKSVKFQNKGSAKNRKPNKVRFKTDDAIEEKDHLFDKYVKKALEDEVASINNINQRKSEKNNMEQMSQMLFEVNSYGKVVDKLTPRLGNRVKFVDTNMHGRILRSREKSQRRRQYSEKQRQKVLEAERESRRRESEKDVGSNKSPVENSRISMYSRAQSRQSRNSQMGEIAMKQKKLIKMSYKDAVSVRTRNTNIRLDAQSLHKSQISRYNSSVRSRKLVAGSGFKGLSPDVVERLTGDHICGKSLCSSNHNPRFLKLARISERKPFKDMKKKDSQKSLSSKKGRKSFRDRSASPWKKSSEDGSIQPVNIDLLKKEMMEAGCDPIDFDNLSKQNDSLDGRDSPGWRRNIQVKLDEDWSKSIIFEAIQEIHNLPKSERDKKQQEVYDRILKLRTQDIFNEEESKYNYSILRKMTSNVSMVDPYDKDQVKEMYKKAKRTVEVLSDILMLSTEDLGGTIEKDGPGLQQMLNAGAGMSPGDKNRSSSVKKSVILLDGSYNTLNSNNVVKLMLRCVKLYQALHDVKQILLIILKSEDMYYEQQNGILKTVVEKYESQPGKRLTQEDESSVIKVLQFFKKLSRRISQFQQDHRLFKIFKFRDQELQQTILKRAKKLGQFLMAQEGEQEQFKYPVLDVTGQLDFVSLSPENPKVTLSTNLEKEGGRESTIDEIKIKDEQQLKSQQSDKVPERKEGTQKRNEQTLQTKESEVLFKTNKLDTESFPYEDKSSNNNDITKRISMEQIVNINTFEPESSQITFQMKQTNQIHTNTNQSQFNSTVTDAMMFTKQAEQSSNQDHCDKTPNVQNSEGIKRGKTHVKNKDSNATIQMEQGLNTVDIQSQEQIPQTTTPLGEVRQDQFSPHKTSSIQRPIMETTFNINNADKIPGARTVYRNNGLQSANPTDDKIMISNEDGSVTQMTVPFIDNNSKGIHLENGSSEHNTIGQIILPIDEEDLGNCPDPKRQQMRFTVVQFGDKSMINAAQGQAKMKPKTPENTSFVRRPVANEQIYEEEEPSATTEITEIRQKGKKTAN